MKNGKRNVSLGEEWAKKCDMLEKFMAANAGAFPTSKYTEVDANGKVVKLGAWMDHQRYNKDKMFEQRLARLQQIPNFPWPKNRSRTQDEEWSYKCGLLEDYVRNHGGKFPVEKYSMQDADGEEINLGMWLYNQKHKKAKVNEYRETRLNAIVGFPWPKKKEKNHTRTLDQEWEYKFSYLDKYVKDHGKFPIQKYVATGQDGEAIKLGPWLTKQKERQAQLTPARKAKLESITTSFPWAKKKEHNHNRSSDEEWNYKCSLLERYVADHGGKFPIQMAKVLGDQGEEIKIGYWLYHQKQYKDKMAPERLGRLDAIGNGNFPWRKKQPRSAGAAATAAGAVALAAAAPPAPPAVTAPFNGKVPGPPPGVPGPPGDAPPPPPTPGSKVVAAVRAAAAAAVAAAAAGSA